MTDNATVKDIGPIGKRQNQVQLMLVGSKNSNLLNDPDLMTEMLADKLAARPV